MRPCTWRILKGTWDRKWRKRGNGATESHQKYPTELRKHIKWIRTGTGIDTLVGDSFSPYIYLELDFKVYPFNGTVGECLAIICPTFRLVDGSTSHSVFRAMFAIKYKWWGLYLRLSVLFLLRRVTNSVHISQVGNGAKPIMCLQDKKNKYRESLLFAVPLLKRNCQVPICTLSSLYFSNLSLPLIVTKVH